MPDSITNNIKSIFGSVVLLATIGASIIAIDTRYALASELEDTKAELQQTQQINKALLEDFMTKQRITTLQDKIFELNIKESPTKIDKAMKQRYQQELDYIVN